MHIKKNIFVVIEGIDRTGKTTVCKRLAQLLNGVTLISFPNRKLFTGELIDKYLKSEVSLNAQTIHLLFSANRWEFQERIKMMEGIVLCDRYYLSGIAYTSAKGIEMDWCKWMDKGLIEPDLLVYIDLPVDIAAKRDGFGNEKYEKIDYQSKVYQQFKLLVDVYEGSKLIVDGTKTIDDIAQTIASAIKSIENK